MDFAATSFVLGYHGCAHSLAQKIIAGRESLLPSHNDYDWLGDGIYFWEHNADRASQFAVEAANRRQPSRKRPPKIGVIGAIIDLGLCLNLLDSRYIEMVRAAHVRLSQISNEIQAPMPRNTGGEDLLKRNLDCCGLTDPSQDA